MKPGTPCPRRGDVFGAPCQLFEGHDEPCEYAPGAVVLCAPGCARAPGHAGQCVRAADLPGVPPRTPCVSPCVLSAGHDGDCLMLGVPSAADVAAVRRLGDAPPVLPPTPPAALRDANAALDHAARMQVETIDRNAHEGRAQRDREIELNERAERLARRITRRGVAAFERIAAALERLAAAAEAPPPKAPRRR